MIELLLPMIERALALYERRVIVEEQREKRIGAEFYGQKAKTKPPKRVKKTKAEVDGFPEGTFDGEN